MQQKKKTKPTSKKEFTLLKQLGARIIELAAKRGVSIEKLAYEGDVSKGYLYDIVSGKGNPSLVVLYRIAEALEVDIPALFK